MARVTPYSVGRRWYCDRSKSKDEYSRKKPPFTFLIVGPGEKPDRKLCRLVVDPGYRNVCAWHGSEQEYTHKHLKKVAVLLPETIEAGDA